MNLTGLSPVEKLHFLDVLINRTKPECQEELYSLYIALGDDLFLIFSVLSGLTLQWPELRDFRSAQISTRSVGRRATKLLLEKPEAPSVPENIKYWDITAMENKRFWHDGSNVLTPASKLVKFERYFSEQYNDYFYPLSKVKVILGREWLLCAKDFRSVKAPKKIEIDDRAVGPEDFIS